MSDERRSLRAGYERPNERWVCGHAAEGNACPFGPDAPCGPDGPNGPESPTGPDGPVTPEVPAAPLGPCSPEVPLGPEEAAWAGERPLTVNSLR